MQLKRTLLLKVYNYNIYQQFIIGIVGTKKKNVHGIQRSLPISGGCFWQIEKAESPLNGNTTCIMIIHTCAIHIQLYMFWQLPHWYYLILLFTWGGHFNSGDQCCIRHLPTQKYLAVVKKGQHSEVINVWMSK